MWSTIGGIFQVLTILVGATFGVLGILSKREQGSTLKKSEKIPLTGILVACILALVTFSVDRIKKQQDRDTDVKRVAEEIERQGKLLLEVQRNQHAIQEFGVNVRYTVPANHPRLKTILTQWNDYIKRSRKSDFDNLGYSKDGNAFAAHDEKGNISRIAIHESSSLFPKSLSDAHTILLPPLALHFNKAGLENDHHGASPFSLAEKNTDLSLFIPLGLINKVHRPQDSTSRKELSISATLWFDVKKAVIEVDGKVNSATALIDTGAIVSLLDLPERKVVLTGLPAANTIDIKSFQITASTGKGRFWSGHKEIGGGSLEKSISGKYRIASYTLKKDDFRGLAAWSSTTGESKHQSSEPPRLR